MYYNSGKNIWCVINANSFLFLINVLEPSPVIAFVVPSSSLWFSFWNISGQVKISTLIDDKQAKPASYLITIWLSYLVLYVSAYLPQLLHESLQTSLIVHFVWRHAPAVQSRSHKLCWAYIWHVRLSKVSSQSLLLSFSVKDIINNEFYLW